MSLPGVEASIKPTYQAANAGNATGVKAAESAHQVKMEGSSKSSSEPEAKISPTQYPGKAKG